MCWPKPYNFCVIAVVSLFVFGLYKAQRKILDGHQTKSGFQFAVYLVKTAHSNRTYDNWVCGGSIVTEWYIITSAACVEDVIHMYAIAGQIKLIPEHKLDTDPCTKSQKRKIVFTCVPKSYDLDYGKIETWSYIDIAVVKVEKKYTFGDKVEEGCSHLIKPIPINYEAKFQEPGIDTLVMGWGHLEKWRQPSDNKNYNQEIMNYASAITHHKNECKTYFAHYPLLVKVIDEYMICTKESGNLDEEGQLIRSSKPIADGCTPTMDVTRDGYSCVQDETVMFDGRRMSLDPAKTLARILQRQQTRRGGICQNDHGGPLIAFIGGQMTLIGVASVFRVTRNSTCTGPFLYTSTQCTSAFLSCILNDPVKRRNYNCDEDQKSNGYVTLRNSISWENHPDGPAENEGIMTRAKPPIDAEQPWRRR